MDREPVGSRGGEYWDTGDGDHSILFWTPAGMRCRAIGRPILVPTVLEGHEAVPYGRTRTHRSWESR